MCVCVCVCVCVCSVHLVALLQMLHQHGHHHVDQHKLRHQHECDEVEGRHQRQVGEAVAVLWPTLPQRVLLRGEDQGGGEGRSIVSQENLIKTKL